MAECAWSSASRKSMPDACGLEEQGGRASHRGLDQLAKQRRLCGASTGKFLSANHLQAWTATGNSPRIGQCIIAAGSE